MPVVQTKIAHFVTDKLNKEFGTDINIEQVSLTVFGGLKLKKVMVFDHHKDTLIYSNRIKTNILDFKKLADGKLLFGDLILDGLYLKMKTYKNESDSNLDVFIDAFDDGKPGSGKFLMTVDDVTIFNSHFLLLDENNEVAKDVDFSLINGKLKDFVIKGANVTFDVQKLSFKDHRGLFVENLKSSFSYTKNNMKLDNLVLQTKLSTVEGNVLMTYDKSKKDFSDFNNKVLFNVDFIKAKVASNDIRYFYNELGRNQIFNFTTKASGTLNNLFLKNLNLDNSQNSKIIGDINFKNLFPKSPGEFYMDGDFSKISTNYNNLVTLLPNILGKNLPNELKKLGQVNLAGKSIVTQKKLDVDLYISTSLGIVDTQLMMSNIDNIDNASYHGNVILDNFDLGNFLDRNDLGRVSLNVDIDGFGFTEDKLNTTVTGDISKIRYNDYNYSKIILDGSFKKPIFKGHLNVNDPNLFLDFNGIVDLSKKEKVFNFQSKIDYANLKNINFLKDSIAVFKGNIDIQVVGNTIDDLVGDINITNVSYQNTKDIYFVDKLIVNSSFDENNERKIIFNSEDAIDGYVLGKFKFNQLVKMVENSLGSLYTNYKPNKIIKGQYLKFNFDIQSKIIEIFFPDITLAENTFLKGNISSDTDEFKMNFNSPSVKAYENKFDNVLLQIDNKNPLYNAYVQIDTIRTKQYKVSDFSLINTTVNDSLYFRTEFKGGDKSEDFYNLNLYHTIDKNKKNIVGFNKSEIQFKDYLWYINEENDSQNKIVFDKNFENVVFDNFVLSHENEKIELKGLLKGLTSKNLKMNFYNVSLNKITPDIEEFVLHGSLNGEVNFRQTNKIYEPTSTIRIDNLLVNDISLGNLNLEILGDDSLKKFTIDSVLENENTESFQAKGDITIDGDQTALDVDLILDNFNLGILSKIGGEVITNIRGFASGAARIDGNINKLDYNGRLFVSKSGLTIPYLNVDYEIENGTIVDITQNKFIIRETVLTDNKFESKGLINGFIKHKNFDDWYLDLFVSSKRLLALNTKDSEDAAYFGTAFIKGEASIKGPAESLVIKVKAESEKGTDIKIPISDTDSVDESDYIHFLTTKEKYGKGQNQKEILKNYNGLEMDFEFDITDDANIEVILNRSSGHGMKGKGFGTLLFKINTLGKFNMWGDFQAYEGSYNFKYGGLIDKKFEVKKGGSISWNGDPMAANLNLEAIYRTTANPAVLLDNPSVNRKVNVEVIIGIKGNLNSPEPDFNINFPNVSSVLRSEIQTKLDDRDVRQTQALYLLASGGFLSPEGVNQNQFSNNLFERASTLFSDIFRDEEGKFNLGLDYVAKDRTAGIESTGRVGVTVTSRISDRITINGKFGVPVGGINESAIVGDVEIQYRVNEDGTLNLRVFNRESNLNYFGQGINYAQGIGVSYEVDFNTFKELVNKIFKNSKLEKVSNSLYEVQDNSDLPDYMYFKENKEKKKESPSQNKEAVPVED